MAHNFGVRLSLEQEFPHAGVHRDDLRDDAPAGITLVTIPATKGVGVVDGGIELHAAPFANAQSLQFSRLPILPADWTEARDEALRQNQTHRVGDLVRFHAEGLQPVEGAYR